MKPKSTKNLCKRMQRFADLTKTFIIQGHINRAEKCLRIANTLLTTGNFMIRTAVANVYVYSLSSLLDERSERTREVLRILPLALRKAYEHQVNSLGV